jgi:hypothetical protein
MGVEAGAELRLREARDLGTILAAAYAAFEDLLSVLWQHQERSGHMFAAFVMSAASAADGRDALAAAPSLPAAGPQAGAPARSRGPDAGIEEVADGLAALSGLLAGRLGELGRCAPGEGDRAACAEAARAAGKVHALLRGTGR